MNRRNRRSWLQRETPRSTAMGKARLSHGFSRRLGIGLACTAVATSAGCQEKDEWVREAPMTPVGAGSLDVSPDDRFSVAAYSERDAVFVTRISSGETSRVPMGNAELGRVIAGKKFAYVIERRNSEVIVIDVEKAREVDRFGTCFTPHGLALSEDERTLHVACASGWLWSIDVENGSPSRKIKLEPDLRDVLVYGDGLAVSKLRTAEVLLLDESGEERARVRPPRLDAFGNPGVAWRLAAHDEKLYLLFQYSSEKPFEVGESGSYGGTGCSSQAVVPTVCVFEPASPDGGPNPDLQPWITEDDDYWLTSMVHLQGVAGAIDMDVLTDGSVAVVAPGNAWAPHPRKGTVIVPPLGPGETTNSAACSSSFFDDGGELPETNRQGEVKGPQVSDDAFVGVAASSSGVVLQMAERAELKVDDGRTSESIRLESGIFTNTGHKLFHMSTDVGIACVSCHPDGADDGQVWDFADVGLRRTQSLRGGVSMRKALHWDGSLSDFDHLMTEVFGNRMGMSNAMPRAQDRRLFLSYLDALPEAESVQLAEETLVEKGETLFFDDEIACSSCHSGARLTDGKIYDVGTGGEFVTPSLLGVGTRAPFLHDGCALTLRDRFGACGGGDQHGVTSHLDDGEIDALVAFLQAQ